MRPENENAMVSRLKLAARRDGPPSSPAACCVPSENARWDRPMSTAIVASTSGWGHAAQAAAPSAASKAPAVSGLRTPMRSINRPSFTPKSIGIRANSAIIGPIRAGDSPACSAASAVVTRTPMTEVNVNAESARSGRIAGSACARADAACGAVGTVGAGDWGGSVFSGSVSGEAARGDPLGGDGPVH